MRIWVVDDESGICQVIEAMLETAGHEVETFGTLGELYRRHAKSPSLDVGLWPEVILMDAMLGGESGLYAAHQLQEQWGSVFRVVVMSGDADIRRMLPDGMFWLGKPFHLNELMQLMDRLGDA
jgi:DNA-binding response OmpR family regulator